MRLTLKHRVLNAKERKGWHSFFVEIYDNGTRVYESLNMVADPKDKAKYRAARQFCQDVIATPDRTQQHRCGLETVQRQVS